MAKQATKGQSRKATAIKTAVAAVAVTAVMDSTTPEPEAFTPPVRTYAGDSWEKQYAILYMKQGKPDYLNAVQPTGDIRADFGHFLFGQGGGKSNDMTDSITKQPGCWPPGADKDGKKYHTVDDITWLLFNNEAIYKAVGYKPTSALFYEMPVWIHDGIVQWHCDRAKVTSSTPVNLLFAYCIWGGGGYLPTLLQFRETYGDIEKFIELKGEYWVFYTLLTIRREVMRQRNAGVNWNTNGRGWSSGLAHFHRVFKIYCDVK
jgi:hypothetical protein